MLLRICGGCRGEPPRRPRPDCIEVAEDYKLVADTLYLAISYTNSFLSTNALGHELQLLGVAAMLIAA